MAENDFRRVFPEFEDCYRATYADGLGRLSRTVRTVAGRQHGWLERVRSGLVALLGFFDDNPSWARLLLLEAPVSESVTFECTRQVHEILVRLLRQQHPTGIPGESPLPTLALTGELVAGGVFSVIRTRLLDENAGKLVELAPSLTAFIVRPYLGQAAASAELVGSPEPVADGVSHAHVPVRLTPRTLLVLKAIGQVPRSNNREIAEAAEIGDEGQASKLLRRLERRSLIENVGLGAVRGEPNAWLLTSLGRRVTESSTWPVADGTFDRRTRRIQGFARSHQQTLHR
jgi:AcrR family transcriptional regulator